MEHLKLYIFPTPSFFTKTVRVTEIGLFSINSKNRRHRLGLRGPSLAVEKAKAGFSVLGFDIQKQKVDKVNGGENDGKP